MTGLLLWKCNMFWMQCKLIWGETVCTQHFNAGHILKTWMDQRFSSVSSERAPVSSQQGACAHKHVIRTDCRRADKQEWWLPTVQREHSSWEFRKWLKYPIYRFLTVKPSLASLLENFWPLAQLLLEPQSTNQRNMLLESWDETCTCVSRQLTTHTHIPFTGFQIVNGADVIQAPTGHIIPRRSVRTGHDPGRAQRDGMDLRNNTGNTIKSKEI